jgi:hypothetical protein
MNDRNDDFSLTWRGSVLVQGQGFQQTVQEVNLLVGIVLVARREFSQGVVARWMYEPPEAVELVAINDLTNKVGVMRRTSPHHLG